MQQYLDLGKRILDEGVWVENKRTGVKCLTVINADLEYDVGAGEFPLLTTRKVPYKGAIAELIGYLRGYTNAQQFADLGAPTWFANANENEAWLNNPHRKGPNDMGLAYRFRVLGYSQPVTPVRAEVPVEQKLPVFPAVSPDYSSNKFQLVGKKFPSNQYGTFTVLREYFRPGTARRIFDIQFCASGYIQHAVMKSEILRGEVKDKYFPSTSGVGCLGEDVNIPADLLKQLKYTWQNMLQRCYTDHEQSQW